MDPYIRPRSEWAGDLQPKGPIGVEADGDVRFLLVHHTASANQYTEDEVAPQLRTFYELHTGPDKGWPDLAYNFMIDRFGRIWEGRAGSIAGPVKGDATGGSQGFAQLCCLIGDHSTEPPTPQAQDAMTDLLAYLANRYGIDPTPGTKVAFTSRGSNLWPAGASVTTNTIAGHRDMSATECPGNAAYALVQTVFAAGATRKLAAASATTTTAPPRTTTTAPTTTSATSSTTTVASTTAADGSTLPDGSAGASRGSKSQGNSPDDRTWLPAAAVLFSALVGGALILRRRRA